MPRSILWEHVKVGDEASVCLDSGEKNCHMGKVSDVDAYAKHRGRVRVDFPGKVAGRPDHVVVSDVDFTIQKELFADRWRFI